MDIYKCPKSIFRNYFWVKKLKVLYILTIFLLKDNFFKSCAKNECKVNKIVFGSTFPKVE
jgi:hypothetical protein